MPLAFKSFIECIRPYEPGKPIEETRRELGLKKVVKLASNENPFGPSRRALEALKKRLTEVSLYPDGSGRSLRVAIARSLSLDPSQIVLGNGSNEMIELVVKGFVREGDNVVGSETSFLVYPLVTQSAGAGFREVPMRGLRYDLASMLKAIDKRTRLVFVANPNNPTGTYVTEREVTDFLSAVPDHVLVCFDEAYADFVDAEDFPKTLLYVKAGRPNCMVLRTFSKSYGLAGLRIGYGAAGTALIDYLHKIRQPFNVNVAAQIAAEAALEDKDFLSKSQALARKGRRYFLEAFESMGLRVTPSQANFVLVDMGFDAREVFARLLQRGFIVRPMGAYGLKSCVRVTVGLERDCRAFVRVLKRVLRELEAEKERSLP